MAALKEYDYQRNMARQQATAQSQQAQDAMKRRFARLGGGLQSGAFIKSQERADAEVQGNLSNQMGAIGAAEAQTQRAMQEADKQRAFQRSERIGGQKFMSGESAIGRRFASAQAGLQRNWQTGERMGSQDFANEQRARGQTFQKSMAGDQRDWATGERLGTQNFTAGQNAKNLAQQWKMFDKNFGLERGKLNEEIRVNKINEELAREMLKNPGMLSSIFGDEMMGGNFFGMDFGGGFGNAAPFVTGMPGLGGLGKGGKSGIPGLPI